MRIDKFLKVAQIIKRRVIGKELGDNQRLFINGRQAKASSSIEVGDVVDIHFGHRHLKIRVLDIKPYVKKGDDPLFELLEQVDL